MSQTYDVAGFPVPKEETVQFPPGWLHSASPEELAAANVYALDDPPSAPAGKVIVSQTLELDDKGAPYWLTTFTKAPKAPRPEPPPELVSVSAALTMPDGSVINAEMRLSQEQIAALGA